MNGAGALTRPPEAVVVGESVPRENGEEDRRQQAVQAIRATLNARNPSLSDAELREMAESLYKKINE